MNNKRNSKVLINSGINDEIEHPEKILAHTKKEFKRSNTANFNQKTQDV